MRDQHRPFLLVLLLLLCVSCRKDKDEEPPRVRILEPQVSFTLAIPDTFTVRVEVSDDKVVRSVYIALTDVNGVPVSSPVTVAVEARSAVVVRDFVVDDERIESGTYTLMARASDGTNESSTFLSVTVQAAPLRLRALFITPLFGASPANILRMDSVGTVTPFTTMQDLNGASVDSYSQHLILAGGLNAPLIALPTAQGSGTWQVPNLNAQAVPYFSGLVRDPADRHHYFSSNDGFIRGFTGDGAQTFTGQALPGFRSRNSVVVGERVVSVQRSISMPDDRLVCLARASGAVMGQFPLDLDVLGMYRRTDEHALLFGNRNGTGVIQDRNVLQGGSFEPREFNGAAISAVVRLDANTWVIALPDQLIRYGYATNSVSLLASGFTAQCLAHDVATGTLYAGAGDQMLALDPWTGTVTNSTGMGMDIGAILPLLNR